MVEPDALASRGSLSDRPVRTLGDGFSFLESPRWYDGRLYVSDFYTSTVYAFTEDGDHESVCRVPGQPSGLGFSPEGDLLVVSRLAKSLLRLRGGDLETVAVLTGAPGFLNDMVVDRAGRAYIGACVMPDDADDAPATELFRVDPDGSVIVAAEGLVFPNGMVIAPDSRTFIVAETFAHRITVFDLAGDGGLSRRRLWIDLAGTDAVVSTSRADRGAPALPDGLALDAEGALWMADARGSGALRIAPDGTVLDMVSTGDSSVYAVALGGHDRRTLFLCVSAPLGVEDPASTRNSALLMCRVDVARVGLP